MQSDRLWLEALSKYPLETVRSALKAHMADPTIQPNGFPVCKSFPMEGEVIARIERMRPPRETYRDPRKPYACDLCSDTGLAYGDPDKKGNKQVRPCACRKKVTA